MVGELIPQRCKATNARGSPCGQRPVSERAYCFWHDPDLEQERREAVRLGGQNHRREQTLSTIYDVDGISTAEDIKRYIEIGLKGLLALENSIARDRALISGGGTALDAYERLNVAKEVAEIRSILDPRARADQPKKKRWGIGGPR